MAAGHQRVKSTRRCHAVGKPVSATAAAVGVAGSAVAVTRRATVVAVDKRHRACEPVADQSCRGLDANAAETTLARRDAHIVRIDARYLAQPLIVRNAVDDQAIDVRKAQARVRNCFLQRPQSELISIELRQLTVARMSDAGDDRTCTTHDKTCSGRSLMAMGLAKCRAWPPARTSAGLDIFAQSLQRF